MSLLSKCWAELIRAFHANRMSSAARIALKTFSVGVGTAQNQLLLLLEFCLHAAPPKPKGLGTAAEVAGSISLECEGLLGVAQGLQVVWEKLGRDI